MKLCILSIVKKSLHIYSETTLLSFSRFFWPKKQGQNYNTLLPTTHYRLTVPSPPPEAKKIRLKEKQLCR